MECKICAREASFMCKCKQEYFCEDHLGKHLTEKGNHDFQNIFTTLSFEDESIMKTQIGFGVNSLKKLKSIIKSQTYDLINLLESNSRKLITKINLEISKIRNFGRKKRFCESELPSINSLLKNGLKIKEFSTCDLKNSIINKYEQHSLIEVQNYYDNINKNKFIEENIGSITCIAITNDLRILIAGSDDCTVRFFEVRTQKQTSCHFLHKSEVTCLAISSDNLLGVSGSIDRTMILYNLNTEKNILLYRQQVEKITSVKFDPTNTKIVSLNIACEIIIWSTKSPDSLKKVISKYVVIDGEFLLSGIYCFITQSEIIAMDLNKLSFDTIKTYKSLEILKMAITKDQLYIFICTKGSFELIKISDGSVCQYYDNTYYLMYLSNNSSVSIKSNNEIIISINQTDQILLWDYENNITNKITFYKHNSIIKGILIFGEWIFTFSKCMVCFSKITNEFNYCLAQRKYRKNLYYFFNGFSILADEFNIKLGIYNKGSFESIAVFLGYSQSIKALKISKTLNKLFSSYKGTKNNLIIWDLINKVKLKTFFCLRF